MMKRILGITVALGLVVPAFAAAEEAAEKKAEETAAAPAKEAEALPPAVTAEKPIPPPEAAADPAAKPEKTDKYNAWFERFKTKHPKAAEHYSKLREAVVDAKSKFDADKKDKNLRRNLLVARRKLHAFWFNFRRHQIKSAQKSIQRWRQDVRKHQRIMKQLARQILK